MPSQQNAQNREIVAYFDYRLEEGHIRSGALSSVSQIRTRRTDRGSKINSNYSRKSFANSAQERRRRTYKENENGSTGHHHEWRPPRGPANTYSLIQRGSIMTYGSALRRDVHGD